MHKWTLILPLFLCEFLAVFSSTGQQWEIINIILQHVPFTARTMIRGCFLFCFEENKFVCHIPSCSQPINICLWQLFSDMCTTTITIIARQRWMHDKRNAYFIRYGRSALSYLLTWNRHISKRTESVGVWLQEPRNGTSPCIFFVVIVDELNAITKHWMRFQRKKYTKCDKTMFHHISLGVATMGCWQLRSCALEYHKFGGCHCEWVKNQPKKSPKKRTSDGSYQMSKDIGGKFDWMKPQHTKCRTIYILLTGLSIT